MTGRHILLDRRRIAAAPLTNEDKTSKGHQARRVADAAAAGSQVRACIPSRAAVSLEMTGTTGAFRLRVRPACYEGAMPIYEISQTGIAALPEAAFGSVNLRE